MKLRLPSPALVISCVALVVACTGTAVGAVVISNSSQVKNNTLTGSDIRNGTLRGIDIKKGSITSNRLSKGTQRLLRKGATGSSSGGSIVAYNAVRKAGATSGGGELVEGAKLTVPAGAYVITASTILSTFPPPVGLLDGLTPPRQSPTGRCVLDAAGDVTQSVQSVISNRLQAPATFHMQVTRTVGAPSDIVLQCGADLGFTLSESSIIALPVSSINLTNLP